MQPGGDDLPSRHRVDARAGFKIEMHTAVPEAPVATAVLHHFPATPIFAGIALRQDRHCVPPEFLTNRKEACRRYLRVERLPLIEVVLLEELLLLTVVTFGKSGPRRSATFAGSEVEGIPPIVPYR